MRAIRIGVVLALAVALLALGGIASAGGGGCHQSGSSEAQGTAVDVGKNCFGPTVLKVGVGETVTWKNYDPVVHTLTAAGGVFDTEIAPGATYTHTFGQEGVFPYYCLLHARMAGAVVVGDGSVIDGASAPVQPVASLKDKTESGGTSPMQASLIATFIAVPLSFAAGRILRGRRQIT